MMLEVNDKVFESFAFYSGILGLKMLLMSPLTGRQRFRKLAFANPEDVKWNNKAKVNTADPDVGVRRAHLNDIENILPFFTVGFLYCFTKPDPATALLLFRTVTGARLLHTLVYAVFKVPQPSRFLAFIAGHLTTIYMAIKVIRHFA